MAKNDSAKIWMPLYIGDYLSDTMSLSTIEHGAYLLILMAYWKNGGPLPADDRKLAFIARVTLDEWSAIRSAIKPFFLEENGQWVNRRADKEIRAATALKDDKGFGAALANLKRFGTPVPEKYAERIAERDAERIAGRTPLPSPSPSQQEKENTPLPPRRGKRAPKTLIHPEWKPSSETLSWCQEKSLPEPEYQLVQFVTYWQGKGEARADWEATFRNWMVSPYRKDRPKNKPDHIDPSWGNRLA